MLVFFDTGTDFFIFDYPFSTFKFPYAWVLIGIIYEKREIGCNCDKVMIQSSEWSVKNNN